MVRQARDRQAESARIARPFIPGSPTSVNSKATSGRSPRIRRALIPSPASKTRYPNDVRATRAYARTSSSSSTDRNISPSPITKKAQPAALAVSELVAIGALAELRSDSRRVAATRVCRQRASSLYFARIRTLARGALLRALRGAGSSSSSLPAMGWPGCLPGRVLRSAAHP
jgi:hypothetical protein